MLLFMGYFLILHMLNIYYDILSYVEGDNNFIIIVLLNVGEWSGL